VAHTHAHLQPPIFPRIIEKIPRPSISMENNLAISLYLTLAGMGLVFGTISLLWGMTALLVRILKRRPRPQPVEVIGEHLLRQRAAIAAVTVVAALEAEKSKIHEFPLPPTAFVSAWQAVLRSAILNTRGKNR